MANYYLVSSSDLAENNIAILKDGRDASERLQKALQEHFDDDTIQVNSLEAQGDRLTAKCARDISETSIEMFNVKLERTFIY